MQSNLQRASEYDDDKEMTVLLRSVVVSRAIGRRKNQLALAGMVEKIVRRFESVKIKKRYEIDGIVFDKLDDLNVRESEVQCANGRTYNQAVLIEIFNDTFTCLLIPLRAISFNSSSTNVQIIVLFSILRD